MVASPSSRRPSDSAFPAANRGSNPLGDANSLSKPIRLILDTKNLRKLSKFPEIFYITRSLMFSCQGLVTSFKMAIYLLPADFD